MSSGSIVNLANPLSPGRQTLETEIMRSVFLSIDTADMDGLFRQRESPSAILSPASYDMAPRTAQWAVSTRYMRSLRLERQSWQWLLAIIFDEPATIDLWVRRVKQNPLRVERSDLFLFEWHEIVFQRMRLQQPPAEQSSNGSIFQILFDVNPRM